MSGAWARVLALAWAAFRAGSLPIGAVVLDAAGRQVAEGRNRRGESAPAPGQMSGSRLAHAELNALTQLPVAGSYGDHTVLTNVEPCCLCLAAMWQTGIGRLAFAWADPYAGATAVTTVDNPQVRRRRLVVDGPLDGTVATMTGLLMAHRYLNQAPGLEHVVRPLRDADPGSFALAARDDVAGVISAAALREDPAGLVAALARLGVLDA